MTNLRKRLALVTIGLAAFSGALALVSACSSTDPSDPADGGNGEASTTDSPTSETGTDGGTDAAVDNFVPVEAGTLAEFVTLNAEATCARFRDCCGGPTKFDSAKCNNDLKNFGWNGALKDLTVAGVVAGGKVTYNAVAGSDCLTKVRNMTCNNTPAAEFKAANEKCYEAAKGTVAASGACRSDVECVSTAYCDLADPDAGVCTTLKGAGASCDAFTGQCAYRGGAGASRCIDTDGDGNSTCSPQIANGQPCGNSDFDCASGACKIDNDAGTLTCENVASFVLDACALFALGDGG